MTGEGGNPVGLSGCEGEGGTPVAKTAEVAVDATCVLDYTVSARVRTWQGHE